MGELGIDTKNPITYDPSQASELDIDAETPITYKPSELSIDAKNPMTFNPSQVSELGITAFVGKNPITYNSSQGSDLLPRGFRFSHRDKSLLAKLVGSFPAILYKGLDAESLSKKMKAWEELTKQFNAKNNGHDFTFTPRHLKALWKRMKVQSKKAATAQAAHGTNGSPLPELSISRIESVMPMILSEAEKIPSDDSYVLPNDPPSPGSFVLPDNPPSAVDEVYSCTTKEDSYSPTPSPVPPTSLILSRCLTNGEKMKKKKPIEIELQNLQEEHRLRMECLRLDREIKILKKWKLEQEILSTGYELPPENYS